MVSSKTNQRAAVRLSLGKKIFFSSFTLFSLLVVFYIAISLKRSVPLYDYLKTKQREWTGNLHRADPVLGYVPVPNSHGFQVFPVGPDVSSQTDGKGFRIPTNQHFPNLPSSEPIMIFLGDSWTYGYACAAEDTFPYLVGKKIKGTAINAGVCGYGLAQILIRSQQLLPRLKPDFLIVQYSSWLVSRSQRLFGPTYPMVKLPTPFFVSDGASSPVLHPPIYQTHVFDAPFSGYRLTPRGTADFLKFYRRVSFPLFLYDDVRLFIFRLKSGLGIDRIIFPAKREIVSIVYGQMLEQCKETNTKMIVVVLGDKLREKDLKILSQFPGLSIVNAQESLNRAAKKDSWLYKKKFYHWTGDPPLLVDTHPNPNAHAIIADQILRKIKELP